MKYTHRNGKQALWCLKDLAISYGCSEELANNLAADVGKELKALEIIKEKPGSISLVAYYDTYEECTQSCLFKYSQLTQEEYNLLREVLL